MKAAENISTMRKEGNRVPGDQSETLHIVIHGDANRFSEDDKQWLKSIITLESNHGFDKTRKFKIEKVPRIFREIQANKNCFDPLVVSVGPYHHGKPELQLMEKHKLTLTKQYVNNNLNMLEELYKKVMNVAKAARECYTDEDEDSIKKLDEKKFTRMMFLDGCFLLQFIYCFAHNKREDLKMKSNIVACVQRDFLLLENQLPFQVLKELMSLRFKEHEWRKMFSNFIAQIRGPRRNSCRAKIKKLVSGKAKAQADELVHFDDEPAHLLEVVRTQLIDKSAYTIPPRSCSDWSSYRSVKELKAVGIHFRPSNTRKFTDVTFMSTFFTAFLKLPPITIDDSTESMLLNMVAYEACPEGPDDFGVSSYICFMDSLIDLAEDVKELRSKGILLNFLGCDQQVADLFNQIADNLVPNPYAYGVVKDRIEKHYKNRVKIWLADWFHTHFTSPWTVIAFFGAMFALFLSVIQTYLAVFPAGNATHS